MVDGNVGFNRELNAGVEQEEDCIFGGFEGIRDWRFGFATVCRLRDRGSAGF